MSLAIMTTEEIVSKYGKNAKDTGNTKVQVTLLTKRINMLSEHIKKNKKDHSNRNSLLKMVGQRRKLLQYLHNTQLTTYRSLINELGLRH